MLIKDNQSDSLITLVRDKKDIITTPLDTSCRTIAGWVLKTGESLLVDDILVDPRFEGLNIINEKLHSVLAVPMKAKGKIIGVIVFQNLKDQKIFNKEHQRFISIIATQSAQLLENAQLYQSVTEENVYLRTETLELCRLSYTLLLVYAFSPYFAS